MLILQERKLQILREMNQRREGRPDIRLIDTFFPDEGPFRRELYPKHIRFFEIGKTERERAAIAGNRVGKTSSIGGYELTRHLLGDYPEWWPGRTYTQDPTDTWAAGDTAQTTRDILQTTLLGAPGHEGSGLIPPERILKIKRKGGSVPDSVESVVVKHRSGGASVLGFKSYDQKRKSFQGTFKHCILLDEEPPWDVYEECLLRIIDTTGGEEGGTILGTFTPLSGMSTVVMYFLGGLEQDDGTVSDGKPRAVVQIGMREVPHISDEMREEILSKLPPYQRKAREDGIPVLGSGAIYPIDIESVVIDPLSEIPRYWPQGYGLDVGWHNTAAAFMAWDRDNDILYLTGEYKSGEKLPALHASAIKARGDWLPGVADPASKGISPTDGERLIEVYQGEGLNVELAERAQREAGIAECLNRFTTGRLLIYSTCVKTQQELGLYRRDKNGKVVKVNDHLLDALRYRALSTETMETHQARNISYIGING